MRPVLAAVAVLSLSAPVAADTPSPEPEVPAVFSTQMRSLSGEPVSFSRYQGKVLLVANTASECGYTPQYADLQVLHETYGSKGLVVIGVPSNEFGGQEPGTAAEIGAFCQKNYGVTFDMMEKSSVKGEAKAPLYAWLTSKEATPSDPGEVKWNFEKFLIGRDGKVVARFRSKVKPTDPEVVKAIETALAEKS